MSCRLGNSIKQTGLQLWRTKVIVRIRWGYDVRKDIQKIKVPYLKTLAQDRRRWKELVEKVKTL